MQKTRVQSVAVVQKVGFGDKMSKLDNRLHFSADGVDAVVQNENLRKYEALCPKEDKGCLSDNLFFKTLRPYLRYMQLFGLFYMDTPSSGAMKSWSYGKIYCLCLNILLLIDFATCVLPVILYYHKFDFSSMGMAILTLAWILQNCIGAMVLFRICSQEKPVNYLFAVWDQLLSCEREKRRIAKYVARKRNIVMAFAIVLQFGNFIGCVLMFYGLIPGYGTFAPLPVDRLFTPHVASCLVVFWSVVIFFISPVWVLPTGLFVLVCLTISHTLERFNESLNQSVENFDKAGGSLASSFNAEYFRLKYQKIIQMVKLADENFSLFLFAMYICNLAVLSFGIYRIMYISYSGIGRIMEFFWAVGSLCVIGILSLASARVNSVAHKVLEDLYAVPTMNMDNKNLMQKYLIGNYIRTVQKNSMDIYVGQKWLENCIYSIYEKVDHMKSIIWSCHSKVIYGILLDFLSFVGIVVNGILTLKKVVNEISMDYLIQRCE